MVWNVFAAPEFSVEPKAECFPFTGCVSYRGFYSEADARRHADELREEGYDVYVGGVPAYSTLGWFDDPLLSTFIRYPGRAARAAACSTSSRTRWSTRKDDTTFNESFAVAVEEEGVRRWLRGRGPRRRAGGVPRRAGAPARVRRARDADARAARRRSTRSSLPREAMLEHKRGEWQRLRAPIRAFPAEPNNAFLVSIAVYTELVPAFERLLAESGGDLESFYRRVQALAAKPAEREAFAQESGISTIFLNAGRSHRRSNHASRFGSAGARSARASRAARGSRAGCRPW